MKKIMCILLTISLSCFAFAGCAGNTENNIENNIVSSNLLKIESDEVSLDIDYKVPTSEEFAEIVKGIFRIWRWDLYDSTDGKLTYYYETSSGDGYCCVNTEKNIYDFSLTFYICINDKDFEKLKIESNKNGITIIERMRDNLTSPHYSDFFKAYLNCCEGILTFDEIFSNYRENAEVKSGYYLYDQVVGNFRYIIKSTVDEDDYILVSVCAAK